MDCLLRVCAALTVLSVLSACGPDTFDAVAATASTGRQSIINGYECGPEELETAVAILVDAEIEYLGAMRSVICTGTLIAPDVVLAAAHCVDADALGMGLPVYRADYYISFATDMAALAVQQSTDFPEDAAPSAFSIRHPDFSLDNMNNVNGPGDYKDIALLFLVDPVTAVRPELVIARDELGQLTETAAVQIAGWGQQTQTDPYQQPPAGTVGIKNCADSFIGELGSYEMQIGGDSNTSRKCHGDSGGPTYLTVDTQHARTRRVVGVTSHAYDASDCAKGGVDTRVDVWLDWIDEQMRAKCDDGSRSWCEVAGIIPPEHYDPPAQPDAGSADSGSDNPLETLGCDCRAAGLPAAGASWLLLGGLLVLSRRARRG